jgi:hypothetical protein
MRSKSRGCATESTELFETHIGSRWNVVNVRVAITWKSVSTLYLEGIGSSLYMNSLIMEAVSTAETSVSIFQTA